MNISQRNKLLIGITILLVLITCSICSIGAALSTISNPTILQASVIPVSTVTASNYTDAYNQIISSSGAIVSELDKGNNASPNTMTRHFATIIDSYETLIEVDAPAHIITAVKPCADTVYAILEGNISQSDALRYYRTLEECSLLK